VPVVGNRALVGVPSPGAQIGRELSAFWWPSWSETLECCVHAGLGGVQNADYPQQPETAKPPATARGFVADAMLIVEMQDGR
jgi:hypothetical protein